LEGLNSGAFVHVTGVRETQRKEGLGEVRIGARGRNEGRKRTARVVDLVRQAFDQQSAGFQLVYREAVDPTVIILAFQDRIGIEFLRGIELFGRQRQRIEVLLARVLVVEVGPILFAHFVDVSEGQFHGCQGGWGIALRSRYDHRQRGFLWVQGLRWRWR